jgi:hypothetical protein
MIKTIRTASEYAAPLLAASALLFALAAPAAAGEPASRQDCDPSFALAGAESPEAELFGAVWTAGRDGSIDGPGELATCTADCGTDPSVTCTGSSCTKQDRNCDSNQRGQCWGTDSGTKYCSDPCPTCIADCEDGSTVTCYGTSCSAEDFNCSTNERGHCWGSGSGTRYCPPLEDCPNPDCDDPTPCEEKNGSFCKFWGQQSDCTYSPTLCSPCFCDEGTWICLL